MKAKIIKGIESRIKAEFKKHKDSDWEEIAARKIYAELDQLVCKHCGREKLEQA